MTRSAYGGSQTRPVRDTPGNFLAGARRLTTTPRGVRSGGLACLFEAASFAFGQPTPDAEALVILERVLEAFGAHVARFADALGVAGGSALLGEERFGVGLRAERGALPGQRTVIGSLVGECAGDAALDGVDEPVGWRFGTVV